MSGKSRRTGVPAAPPPLPSAQGSCRGRNDLVPSRSSWLGGPVCARESAPASSVHTEDVPACPLLLRGPVLVGALTPVRGPPGLSVVSPSRRPPSAASRVVLCCLLRLPVVSCKLLVFKKSETEHRSESDQPRCRHSTLHRKEKGRGAPPGLGLQGGPLSCVWVLWALWLPLCVGKSALEGPKCR